MGTSFPKFWLLLESLNFIIDNKHDQLFFLERTGSFCSFYKDCQIAKSEYPRCLLAVLSSKNSVPWTKRRISANANELSNAFSPQSSTQASSQSALYSLPISWHRVLKVVYSRAKSQWNLLFLLLHQGSSSVILTYFFTVTMRLYRTQPSLGLLPCFLLECQQFHPLWLFNHQMLS